MSAATAPANLRTTAAEAAVAVQKLQGRRALEVRSVRCVDATTAQKLDQDCWAVSIDPHGMVVPSQGPIRIHWDLAFVDAGTGKVIEARLG